MVNRRSFLSLSGAGVATAMVAGTATAHELIGAEATFDKNPFQLGSASGDATTDSVILWTRLTPDPTAKDLGMGGQPDAISVHWRFAESYEDVQSDDTSLYHGDVDALRTDAWSIHLEVKDAGGPLEPGKQYYYQFSLPDQSHKAWIGKTRTAPLSDADVTANFAVISCQSAATIGGPTYWHGYTHLEDNPVDFVVHVGDYIYRESNANTIPADEHCSKIADYRRRWGWYLTRDNLQRTRRLYPIYAVPDDHDFYNNCQGANIKPRLGEGTDWQLQCFNNGMRTFWENMPMRGPRPSAPDGQHKFTYSLKRIGLNWGAHLDLALMDTRQFRTDPEADEPTMLGSKQLSEVLDFINGSSATWTTLGSTSPLCMYFRGKDTPTSPVNWSAYPHEREQITEALAARNADGGNSIVVAGDVHCGFAAKVVQPTDPASKDYVATEFSVPPMGSFSGTDWEARRDSSPNIIEWMGLKDDGSDHNQPQPLKGYLRCTASKDRFNTNFIAGNQPTSKSGKVSSVAKLRVMAGEIGAEAR
ncbi:MAG TPA: alkaline phosphatase D family protein [Candidatus Stackebrandtia faecavium]|nr:alkaline phosphatase D family protein [Candidatus Stackebrandtia faecavium]